MRASRQPCSILNASLISRSFSSTNTLSRGALPVYLESSTPELTTLLRELNAKILAPQHYTKEQAALVFKSSNKAKLEAEPVEITLGDVTLPLVHIDRNKDVPKHWTTFSSIVDGSETPQDFENALRMLEGFHNAGIKVNVGWQSKLVRKLSIAGMQGTIIKMLQRGKATGVSLREQQVVMMVLSSIYGQAASGDWAKDVTTRAYKYAVQVVEMMDDSVHHGNVTKGAERDDYRGDPRVVAVPTGLAAALAKVHGGDKEQVKKLASRLVSALQQDDFDVSSSSQETTSSSSMLLSRTTNHIFFQHRLSSRPINRNPKPKKQTFQTVKNMSRHSAMSSAASSSLYLFGMH